MMAVGHALSGWCTGLLVGAATALPIFADSAGSSWNVVVVLTVSFGLAGSALLPDIDHHGSTVTTSGGYATWMIHRGVVHLHNSVCQLTWNPGEAMPGAHRGITHWWPTPLISGFLVGFPCWLTWWAAWPVLSLLFALAILGITVPEYRPSERHTPGVEFAHRIAGFVPTIWLLKRIRRKVGRAGKIAVLATSSAAAWGALWYSPEIGRWLGVVVAAGMVLHILGDAPTLSRVPGWTLRGELWLPRWLAFRAGGSFEVLACWVPMSVFGVFAAPGVLPLAMSAW